jgi:opacity protein-like surface antigen
MQSQWTRAVFTILAFIALHGVTVCAQTDVGISLDGAFNEGTSSLLVKQSPSNSAGGLIELRHISNPLVGFEATYAYNRANQGYSLVNTIDCFPNICVPSAAVSANAHEITGDWLVSLKVGNLRPFALAGAGLLVDVPVSAQARTSISTNNSTKPVYVYGGGVDWGLVPHLGLRFQYRGNFYRAPALTSFFTSTNAFTHTAEPMIGAYIRF